MIVVTPLKLIVGLLTNSGEQLFQGILSSLISVVVASSSGCVMRLIQVLYVHYYVSSILLIE